MSHSKKLWSIVLDTARTARYHSYTLWLFTRSDLKTIVLPTTVFAIIHSIAASKLGLLPANSHPMAMIPLSMLWTWINLLAFCIGNQRQPKAFEEDALNKPWRPLPAQRLSTSDAKLIMIFAYGLSLAVSLYLGALGQCCAAIFFGYLYNDLRGADKSPYTRNIINGFGYVCFTSGALEVTLQGNQAPVKAFTWWFITIFMIITTTIHSQDMHDQEGDAATDRKTVPLVVGDVMARYLLAIPVAFWTVFCPFMWSCSALCYVPVVALGALVSFRVLTMRTVAADKRTALLWNIWLTSVFCIPLLKSVC